jgi:hypothetical protein
MQLDIYRRSEPGHKLSYLAVPAGQPIPEEAASAEWQQVATATEMDVEAPSLAEYAIDEPGQQIREKGYAITRVEHQVEANS